MSNKHYIGKSVNTIEASKEFSPYTKVVIIAGEDENGTQLVYEAGNDNGRTLEVTNPWGTQQIANDMLIRIQGYTYKPYSASGAYLPDTAELGDGVTVNGIYSVLASQDLTFDSLAVSDIEAPGADETENEFGIYVDSTKKDLKRKVNTISTKFTVELGKIESEINDPANGLSTRITQNTNSITSEVTRATRAEGNLSSRITQTADDILLSVKGDYAPEWNSGKTYYADDVVKVTTYSNEKVSAVKFYKCRTQHTSSNSNKPPNSTYWTAVSAPTVQSMIDMNLDGISISYSNSASNNSSYVRLMKDGVEIGGGTVTMGNVVADSVSASWVYAGNIASSKIIVGDNETLAGLLTTESNRTVIDGNKIQTGSISADKLDAGAISTNTLDIGNDGSGVSFKYYNATVGSIKGDGASNIAISADSGDVTISAGSGNSKNVNINANDGSIILNVDSNIQLNGRIDSIGYINDDLIPYSNDYYSCGGASRRWDSVYARYVSADDLYGDTHSTNQQSSSSDRNKKKDIIYGLEAYDRFFDGLNPCTFRFVDGHERKHFGVIAQDVEELIESCGMTSMDVAALVKDYDEGTESYKYYLRYGEFIPLLIWEVQQLKRKVEGFENERAS